MKHYKLKTEHTINEKKKMLKSIVEYFYLNIQWLNYNINYYCKKREENPLCFTRKNDLLTHERLLHKIEVILAVTSYMIKTNESYTLDLFASYYKQNVKYRLYYLQTGSFFNYNEKFLDLWLSSLYQEDINEIFIIDLESDLVTNLKLRKKLLKNLKIYIESLNYLSDNIYFRRCLYKPSPMFSFLAENLRLTYKGDLYIESDKITRNRFLFELFEYHYYTVKNEKEARELYLTFNLFYQYAGKAAIDFLYFDFKYNEFIWLSTFYDRRQSRFLIIKEFLQNKKKRFDQELIDLIEESLGFEAFGFRGFFLGKIKSGDGGEIA